MPDGTQAVVLCEGLQDSVFVRRALIELGYEPRRIRVLPFPHDGQGSGEQHVRERYPNEVRSHRSGAARMKTVLVVHTDADTRTVQDRYHSLEEQLDAAQMSRRGPNEAIAVLIPKRNTETWIHYFDGQTVDEATHYPKMAGREADAWDAAKTFAKLARSNKQSAPALASLARGLQEIRRVI